MRWDGNVWRRWNGRRWATAAYSTNPDGLRLRARPDSGPVIGDETARRVMSSAVEDQVATNGATVVLDGAQGVILGYRRRTAHAFHAAMTLVTAGLWAPVWILSSLRPGEERIRLSVDAWGHVWATPVASP